MVQSAVLFKLSIHSVLSFKGHVCIFKARVEIILHTFAKSEKKYNLCPLNCPNPKTSLWSAYAIQSCFYAQCRAGCAISFVCNRFTTPSPYLCFSRLTLPFRS